MKNLYFDKISEFSDIIPMYAGEERCVSGHSYGPCVRSQHLIHFCLSGSGTLYDKFGEHKISAGEFFVIRPGEVTTYTADSKTPWHYVWIGFGGRLAKKFSADRSVYASPLESVTKLHDLVESEELSPYAYTSVIYDVIYRVFSFETTKSDGLSKIKKYIRYNYMLDITADGISKEFGYERSYLYRIFKKRYGVGVKEYIIKVRMENAKAFLEAGHTVCDTARMTGYGDEFNFSRGYKKYYGTPPSQARRPKNEDA